MAARGARGARALNDAFKGLTLSPSCYISPSASFARSMATETSSRTPYTPVTSVPLTIFDFPSFEPQRLESWSAKHLNLPLRRDILHLAVVYEGDNTRQGTAHAKNRYEVHGSHKKMRPQKGMGRSRMGTRQSPLLRGGGKVFGPRHRDFGTGLPRKVYDLAWRTALSYRYRRGELIVCHDGMDLALPRELDALLAQDALYYTAAELETGFKTKWVTQMLEANDWGRQAGRSTFITSSRRDSLFDSLDLVPNMGRALDVSEVDVKDLLETGRLVIEREALMQLIDSHQSDLTNHVFITDAAKARLPRSGGTIVD
ncbi:ribosomal protein L4/L1 family protein [Xylariaceae sp. FL1019]|nr:ribosomal protein L4/L1 family protein [Xylariaceae sp. FL1019]